MNEYIDKLTWLVVKDRQVLFLRSRGKDTFYTPGGKREGNETDQAALVREINEELGVNLDLETINFAHEVMAQAHGKPEGVMVRLRCYWAEYEGELKPLSEIEELAWFTSDDEDKTSATGVLILQWLKEQDLID